MLTPRTLREVAASKLNGLPSTVTHHFVIQSGLVGVACAEKVTMPLTVEPSTGVSQDTDGHLRLEQPWLQW